MIILLIALYVACELIANITAVKPVAMGSFVVPAGVFIFALSLTFIDLINERLGKQRARQVVYGAFAASFLLAIYCQFAIALPAAPFYEWQEGYAAVLGSTWRIAIASLTAFLVASLIDVEIFAWWRQRFGRYKWARVLASNTISTLVDSVIFITIAFWGEYALLPMIEGQYAVKMGITAISIPLIYLIRARPLAMEPERLA